MSLKQKIKQSKTKSWNKFQNLPFLQNLGRLKMFKQTIYLQKKLKPRDVGTGETKGKIGEPAINFPIWWLRQIENNNIKIKIWDNLLDTNI